MEKCNRCLRPVDKETVYCGECIESSWLLQIISSEDFPIRVHQNAIAMAKISSGLQWFDESGQRVKNKAIPIKKRERNAFDQEVIIVKWLSSVERLHEIQDVDSLESAIMKVVLKSKRARSHASIKEYRESLVINVFAYDQIFENTTEEHGYQESKV